MFATEARRPRRTIEPARAHTVSPRPCLVRRARNDDPELSITPWGTPLAGATPTTVYTQGERLLRRTRSPKVPNFREHVTGDCPPVDSVPADGVFYRVVSEAPIGKASFLSYYELGKKCPIRVSPCQWAGVSIYINAEEASKLAEAGGRLEGMKLARGALVPDHGKTKLTTRNTNGTHTTYWPYEDAEPWVVFSLVGEEAVDDG